MVPLASLIAAGAEPGATYRLAGFTPHGHVHTYSGRPVERPEGWVDGAEVVFLGWRQTAYLRRGLFSVDGEVWGGKGLASCLLVEA